MFNKKQIREQNYKQLREDIDTLKQDISQSDEKMWKYTIMCSQTDIEKLALEKKIHSYMKLGKQPKNKNL